MTNRALGENRTDQGNARRLIARFGDALRYVQAWGWLFWDGCRWLRDETGEADRRAKDTVRHIYGEAQAEKDAKRREDLSRHALASERAGAIDAMLKMARTEPEIVATARDFDRDPWLFNVRNGTLNLKTGMLQPHRREDLITKLAPVDWDPDAKCPRFLRALLRIMAGDRGKVRFLQRAIGYSATGETTEQCMFLPYGLGANGKGLLVRTVKAVMGDYFQQADITSFLVRRGEGPREDIASLFGARFVAAAEPDEGARLAEGLIKVLTGQDDVAVRHLYRDRFTYTPTFKIWLSANKKPKVRGTDHGIWRRIHLVPFTVTITPAEVDKTLEPTLQREELPGILRWVVAGCLAWQRDGLRVPDTVRVATQSYRDESNPFGRFIAEECVLETGAVVPFAKLYSAYTLWAEEEGVDPLGKAKMAAMLTELSIPGDKHPVTRSAVRCGLRLKAGDELSPNGKTSDARDGLSGNFPCTPTREKFQETPSGASAPSGAGQLWPLVSQDRLS